MDNINNNSFNSGFNNNLNGINKEDFNNFLRSFNERNLDMIDAAINRIVDALERERETISPLNGLMSSIGLGLSDNRKQLSKMLDELIEIKNISNSIRDNKSKIERNIGNINVTSDFVEKYTKIANKFKEGTSKEKLNDYFQKKGEKLNKTEKLRHNNDLLDEFFIKDEYDYLVNNPQGIDTNEFFKLIEQYSKQKKIGFDEISDDLANSFNDDYRDLWDYIKDTFNVSNKEQIKWIVNEFNEIQRLTSECKELENDIDELSSSLDEFEQSLNDVNNESKRIIDDYNNQISQTLNNYGILADVENDSVSDIITKIKDEVSKAAEKKAKNEIIITQLESELADLEIQLQRLENQYPDETARPTNINDEIDDIKNNIESRTKEIEIANASNIDVSNLEKVIDLLNERDALEKELIDNKKVLDDIQGSDYISDVESIVDLRHEELNTNKALLETQLKLEESEANKGKIIRENLSALDDINRKRKEEERLIRRGANRLATMQGVYRAIKETLGKALGTWMEYEDTTFRIARGMGLNREQAQALTTANIKNVEKLAIAYGVSKDAIMKLQQGITDATQRNIILTREQTENLLALSKIADEATVAEAVESGAQLGVSINDSMAKLALTQEKARAFGLNAAKASQAFAKNMHLASTYSFRNGTNGLANMLLLSQKLRFNMESITSAADKFQDIEGSIETAAKIQMLGGSYARNFSNPMAIMYEATSDIESFTERIVRTVKDKGIFNRETGEVSVAPIDKAFIREFASAIGMSFDEVMKMVNSQVRNANVDNEINKNQNFSEIEKSFIETNAEWNSVNKRFELAILDQNGKEVGTKAVSSITKEDIDQIQTNTIDEKNMFKDTRQIRNAVLQIAKRQGIQMTSLSERKEGFQNATAATIADFTDSTGLGRGISNLAMNYSTPAGNFLSNFGSTLGGVLVGGGLLGGLFRYTPLGRNLMGGINKGVGAKAVRNINKVGGKLGWTALAGIGNEIGKATGLWKEGSGTDKTLSTVGDIGTGAMIGNLIVPGLGGIVGGALGGIYGVYKNFGDDIKGWFSGKDKKDEALAKKTEESGDAINSEFGSDSVYYAAATSILAMQDPLVRIASKNPTTVVRVTPQEQSVGNINNTTMEQLASVSESFDTIQENISNITSSVGNIEQTTLSSTELLKEVNTNNVNLASTQMESITKAFNDFISSDAYLASINTFVDNIAKNQQSTNLNVNNANFATIDNGGDIDTKINEIGGDVISSKISELAIAYATKAIELVNGTSVNAIYNAAINKTISDIANNDAFFTNNGVTNDGSIRKAIIIDNNNIDYTENASNNLQNGVNASEIYNSAISKTVNDVAHKENVLHNAILKGQYNSIFNIGKGTPNAYYTFPYDANDPLASEYLYNSNGNIYNTFSNNPINDVIANNSLFTKNGITKQGDYHKVILIDNNGVEYNENSANEWSRNGVSYNDIVRTHYNNIFGTNDNFIDAHYTIPYNTNDPSVTSYLYGDNRSIFSTSNNARNKVNNNASGIYNFGGNNFSNAENGFGGYSVNDENVSMNINGDNANNLFSVVSNKGDRLNNMVYGRGDEITNNIETSKDGTLNSAYPISSDGNIFNEYGISNTDVINGIEPKEPNIAPITNVGGATEIAPSNNTTNNYNNSPFNQQQWQYMQPNNASMDVNINGTIRLQGDSGIANMDIVDMIERNPTLRSRIIEIVVDGMYRKFGYGRNYMNYNSIKQGGAYDIRNT